tara:strand:+ start:124 stop:366 length:243 start_codon:yes stop_codon:yes gene_type:complete
MLNWISSAEMASALGCSKYILLKIRRQQWSPFIEGVHFRWIGLSDKGTLSWQPEATQIAFSSFRRVRPVEVETYSKALTF